MNMGAGHPLHRRGVPTALTMNMGAGRPFHRRGVPAALVMALMVRAESFLIRGQSLVGAGQGRISMFPNPNRNIILVCPGPFLNTFVTLEGTGVVRPGRDITAFCGMLPMVRTGK